jgi:hypothetical protein
MQIVIGEQPADRGILRSAGMSLKLATEIRSFKGFSFLIAESRLLESVDRATMLPQEKESRAWWTR